MNKKFSGKVTTFVMTFVIALIIVGFLFSSLSGYNAPSVKDVANVGGTPITAREFQGLLARQIDFYAQMTGKQLTQNDVEQMGIKNRVLENLIQQKLIFNQAKDAGLAVGENELKDEIKNLPYFKTNEKFDVSKYRGLLQQNGYTPTQFEDLITEEILTKKIESLFDSLPVAKSYAKSIVEFKNTQASVSLVKINRNNFTQLIEVSKDEVMAFLDSKESQKALDQEYATHLDEYQKPAEVKARHILFKGQDSLKKAKAALSGLTVKNFKAKAQKLTEDPSGKQNGGDLGWFSKGRMVKEFEEAAFQAKKGSIIGPIKTDFGHHLILVEGKRDAINTPIGKVSNELAVEILKRRKMTQLNQIMDKKLKEYQSLLENNKVAQLKTELESLDGVYADSLAVNEFNQSLQGVELSDLQAQELFTAKKGAVLNFGNPGQIYLVKVLEEVSQSSGMSSELDKKIEAEMKSMSMQMGRKFRQELLKEATDSTKISTNPRFI